MRIDEVISCDVARALEIISKAPSIRFACRFVPVANCKLPFANNSLIDDASDQLDGQGAATISGADIRVSSRGRERTTESGRMPTHAICILRFNVVMQRSAGSDPGLSLDWAQSGRSTYCFQLLPTLG